MSTRRPIEPFERDPAAVVSEPEPDRRSPELPALPRRRRSPQRYALAAAITGAVGLFAADLVSRVGGLLVETPLLGTPFVLFLALFATGSGAIVVREWLAVRRLGRRAELREQAARLVGSDLHGEAEPLLGAIARELQAVPELAPALARHRSAVHDHLADGEHLALFERQVLAPLDRRAYRLVLESSRDIGVLSALAPAGLFAGLLVLWRTFLMLRSVATLYGMSPGGAASLALFRRAVRNALLAGLADMATHTALEHMGAGMAALLSARAGQGAGNALLAARLGVEAIRLSRPLPFVVEKPPSLRQVTKSLFASFPDAQSRS